MRRLKDRDFLKTVEGFLFCVVGYSHPRDRVVSYLKYVPSNVGKWGRGGERYARTMPNYTIPSLLSNIEMLKRDYPRYVFHSRVFNILMSAVPHDCIAERYFAEAKLQTLFKSRELDSLQETTTKLVSFLSSETGVPKNDFGVTGSLLTDIHNPNFSDIDLIISGRTNAWKIREMLKETAEGTSLRKPSEQQRNKTLKRWTNDYPLTLGEAEEIYSRRWNYGYFDGKVFSIHAVRKDEEIVERYGENRFYPQGIVEGEAKITGVDESLFLPCKYKVKGFKTVQGNPMEVDEVVSYDGLYSGLFGCSETIRVRGKLEKVVSRRGDSYFRILIGSPEAKGKDYIKPSNQP